MPLTDDQLIDVQPEDPKVSASQNNSKSSHTNIQFDVDDLDDLMFDMTAPSSTKPTHVKTKATVRHESNHYVNEQGQAKDAWFKEEEQMRKKLEKGAIAQLKSRIAQQNKAAGNSKNHVPEVNHHDNDSDIDPNDMKPDHDVMPSGGGAVNPTQVQLSPAQVEEAKQVTYGKLKQFRRDRLHQSDRERLQYLSDHLKKIRVMDDQSNMFNVGFNYGGSPNRTSQNKNYEHQRGTSPSKISPNKTSGGV